jgi:hypothetical protein
LLSERGKGSFCAIGFRGFQGNVVDLSWGSAVTFAGAVALAYDDCAIRRNGRSIQNRSKIDIFWLK